MRRLLTSYALYFNLRHNRVGHLFQNRYKSIVCEEERYLVELIRYIHLNPVRAGLVRDGDGLQRTMWFNYYNEQRRHSKLDKKTPDEAYFQGLEKLRPAA
jgi:transposase InsO family protein